MRNSCTSIYKTIKNLTDSKIEILTVIILSVLPTIAGAQILKPVKWSNGAKKTSTTEAVVYLKAVIEEGWHIYSVKQADGGPIKTSFTFTPSRDYILVGKIFEPTPIKKYEKTFAMDVKYFAKEVIFSQKIKLKSAKAIVKGKLNFMVCNNEKCLPPEDVDFSIPVK